MLGHHTRSRKKAEEALEEEAKEAEQAGDPEGVDLEDRPE